ncbi:MAG: TonB-dependent receptor [Cyanobacteria bacterium P01_A01_bin.116]
MIISNGVEMRRLAKLVKRRLKDWRFLSISLLVIGISVPAQAESYRFKEQSSERLPAAIAQVDSFSQTTITDMQVSSTADGLEVVLVSDQALVLDSSQISGNAFVANIPNAVLNLSDPATAEQFGPAEGIALVQLSALPDNRVQLSITGTQDAPNVQVSAIGNNLVLSVTPATTAEGEISETEDSDAIQLVVTATRTEEDVLDIPRSVTVIDREQLEEQQQLTDNFPDILGKLVPGLGPPTLQNSTRGLSLRGRTALVLIDGIPQNPNSGFNTELNTIDPAVVERVEILRGPSAVYGDGATGGIINIITRSATDDPVAYNVSVGTSTSLTSIGDDSFGYNVQLGAAHSDDDGDARIVVSYDANNAQFDANGDRIPPNGLTDVDGLGVLAKLGFNLSEQQRLSLTYNLYRETLDTRFGSDPSIVQIPGLQAARAIEIDGIDYDREPEQLSQVLNLTYSHSDLLSSRLDAQLYYRDTELAQRFTDLRGRGLPAFFPVLWQTGLDSSEWGGRLQFDTAFSDNFGLLWGADYAREENERLVIASDTTVFDNDQRLDASEILSQSPEYDLESLGLFTQATWDISDQWQLSGGVRYDRFDFSVEDSTLAFSFPQERQGGSGNADDVSFNAGLLYNPTPEVGLFASFSQGFSIPDLGLTLAFVVPADADVSSDLLLEPQKVNNFEVGVRTEFDAVQASLAGFYNESSLGTTLSVGDSGFTEVSRAPQRNYGVEATLDWQPSNQWRLGGNFSWNEGENDVDDDGDFLALSSLQVQPYKALLYVENDTTSTWTNRLQLLGVGGRDRAFNDAVDGFDIDGYITLDWLSQFQIGDGTLTLGIENLLNNQYLPVSSQERIGGTEDRRFAAPGATVSVRYSIDF